MLTSSLIICATGTTIAATRVAPIIIEQRVGVGVALCITATFEFTRRAFAARIVDTHDDIDETSDAMYVDGAPLHHRDVPIAEWFASFLTECRIDPTSARIDRTATGRLSYRNGPRIEQRNTGTMSAKWRSMREVAIDVIVRARSLTTAQLADAQNIMRDAAGAGCHTCKVHIDEHNGGRAIIYLRYDLTGWQRGEDADHTEWHEYEHRWTHRDDPTLHTLPSVDDERYDLDLDAYGNPTAPDNDDAPAETPADTPDTTPPLAYDRHMTPLALETGPLIDPDPDIDDAGEHGSHDHMDDPDPVDERPPDARPGTRTGDLWDALDTGVWRTRESLAGMAELAPGTVSNTLRQWELNDWAVRHDGRWKRAPRVSNHAPAHSSDTIAHRDEAA